MFPILTFDKPESGKPAPQIPEDFNGLIVAGNGLQRVLNNPFYTLAYEPDLTSHYAKLEHNFKEQKAFLEIKVVRLSLQLFKMAENFFTAVYAKHKGESAVVLFYNPELARWALVVPPQEVSAAHVDYKLKGECLAVYDPRAVGSTEPERFEEVLYNADATKCPQLSGYTMFGTIHSHSNFAAFHSGTDDKDEKEFDGLHITIGHVDQPRKSYSSRWIFFGKIFPCDIPDCVDTPELPNFSSGPGWLAQTKEKTTSTYPLMGAYSPHYHRSYGAYGYYGADVDEWEGAGKLGWKNTYYKKSEKKEKRERRTRVEAKSKFSQGISQRFLADSDTMKRITEEARLTYSTEFGYVSKCPEIKEESLPPGLFIHWLYAQDERLLAVGEQRVLRALENYPILWNDLCDNGLFNHVLLDSTLLWALVTNGGLWANSPHMAEPPSIKSMRESFWGSYIVDPRDEKAIEAEIEAIMKQGPPKLAGKEKEKEKETAVIVKKVPEVSMKDTPISIEMYPSASVPPQGVPLSVVSYQV